MPELTLVEMFNRTSLKQEISYDNMEQFTDNDIKITRLDVE